MGKYSILGRKLKDLAEDEITFTFTEVEGILGFKLPPSARKYRPWWANDRTHSHACDGWLDVGWKVKKTDLSKGLVLLHRVQPKSEELDILKGHPIFPTLSSLTPADSNREESKDNITQQYNERTGSVDEKKQRVLILLPCSGSKTKAEVETIFTKSNEEKVSDFLDETKNLLMKGREGMRSFISATSSPISALGRYSGYLYSVPDLKKLIMESYSMDNIHYLIISGAYGLLTPSERIHYYEKQINASYWKKYGLLEVIEEYIELKEITHVYGFFSRTTDYMRIIKGINWQKLRLQSSVTLARTYFVNFTGTGGAQKIVPEITGNLIKSFIKSNFNSNNFYENPFKGQYIDFQDHIS